MAATLQRQDAAGATLVLDGVISSSEIRDLMVSQHPAQGLATITDHVQAKAIGKAITWVVSQHPTVEGITAGPQRLAEVLDWLKAAEGVLLTLVEPGLPVRADLLLQGYPWRQAGSYAITVDLKLLEARFATVTTFEVEGRRVQRPGRTPRADVAAGFTETADRGLQPVRDQSALAAGFDLGASLVPWLIPP
jgi:hypothetical protein